jgi:tetratricopeptide (TPR) repeat protein
MANLKTATKEAERLREENVNDARAWLRCAFAFDRLGYEERAVPLYSKTISIGLIGDDLRDALVCLGSSLHTLKRFNEAIQALQRATRNFPGDRAVSLFLALALLDAKRSGEAVKLLGQMSLKISAGTEVDRFRRVLTRKYGAIGQTKRAALNRPVGRSSSRSRTFRP